MSKPRAEVINDPSDAQIPVTQGFVSGGPGLDERVPPEILGEIFHWTLPHTRRIAWRDHPTSPWRLALVSKRWRECALAYPRLWSSIHIDGNARDIEGDDYLSLISDCYPLSALETQLRRSVDAPLQLSFLWPPILLSDNYPSHLSELLEVLALHCHRWRAAQIIWDDYDPAMFRTLASIKGRLPLLTKLEFHPQLTGPLDDICDLFANAPCLQEVLLTDQDYRCESTPISIPWVQITRLRAKWNMNLHLAVLRAAPNLVECGLASFIDDDDVDDMLLSTTPVVTLPRVERLFVLTDGSLEYLQAPVLRHLFIDGSVARVPAFLRSSGCHLTALTVFNCISDTLIPVLKTIPNLSSLQLSFHHWSALEDRNALFAGLTVFESSSVVLCPNLARIRIVMRAKDSYTAVLGMVESRWRSPSSHLQFVRIVDLDAQFAASGPPAGFDALKKEGLDVLCNSDVEDPEMVSP
ncbi:hypothetical protein B0H13DRAFT_2668735 [Mycena leptocephala]|nr:hypothetical protein B0H13DRAFT_2668735 [Mycena leptocephala]